MAFGILRTPQFGLTRQQQLSQTAAEYFAELPAPATDPAPAPTVIVKRKRVLDIPEANAGGPTSSLEETQPAAKTPRVYRLNTQDTQGPSEPSEGHETEAPAEGVEAFAADHGHVGEHELENKEAPVRRRYRRRDPVRAPVLVRHIVYEQPEQPTQEVATPAEPVLGAEALGFVDLATQAEWLDIQASMARLEAQLAKLEAGRRALKGLCEAMSPDQTPPDSF